MTSNAPLIQLDLGRLTISLFRQWLGFGHLVEESAGFIRQDFGFLKFMWWEESA